MSTIFRKYVRNARKSIQVFLLFTLLPLPCIAQSPQYRIAVNLDTAEHLLKGEITISFTNRFKRSVDSLGIHLWMNAFKNNHSALVQQMLNLGQLDLYRAEDNARGWISDLDFISDDRKVSLQVDSTFQDVGWLILSTPLKPGETIQLSSPFVVKIPRSFSRPGRTASSYQLTQWYPHLAVLNEDGWHTMPYLDQGEFFNDFADYEVTIRTPLQYKIAATGILVSEKSGPDYIERIFKAENVIDFAWFASHGFIYRDRIIDSGGKRVHLQLYVEPYLNERWDDAMAYAERAMHFYSDWLGPYPYPQMTVVHTPFSNAGFMEYPMVAQISHTDDSIMLDRVIAHEIGHTWIYGTLASNERMDPWLDEGFNSFIESRYMKKYYGDDAEKALPAIFHASHSMDHYDALLHIARAKRTLQPPLTRPENQSGEQYLFSAYMLPAKGLEIMQVQLGEDIMKKMYRRYFEDHQFTHVDISDARSSFQSACGCNLSWFFDDWLRHSHQIDYRIKKFDRKQDELTLVNHAHVPLPLTLAEFDKQNLLRHTWIDGFNGAKILPLAPATERVELYHRLSPDKHWKNDVRPRVFKPHITLIPKIGNEIRPSISVTPVFGYNRTDGLMPGIAVVTDLIPQPRFKLLMMPLYGVDSGKWRGYGELRYISDIQTSFADKWMLGFSAGTFGYQLDTHYLFRDHFSRFSPSLALRIRPSSQFSKYTSWLKYRFVGIEQHYGVPVNAEQKIYKRAKRTYGIHELSFQLRHDTVLRPLLIATSVQGGKGFVRFNMHYRQHFRGKDKLRGIWTHGFIGWLPYYEQPDANVALYINGLSSNGFYSKDYMYDEWLIGRNENNGSFSHQVFMKDAGLKTLSTIGISEKWMLGGGFSFSLPLKFIHVYMDGAVYPSAISETTAFTYSGGLSLILMKDAFEIYLPLVESKDIRQSLSYVVRDRWWERVSFQANFKLANPLDMLDRWQFRY